MNSTEKVKNSKKDTPSVHFFMTKAVSGRKKRSIIMCTALPPSKTGRGIRFPTPRRVFAKIKKHISAEYHDNTIICTFYQKPQHKKVRREDKSSLLKACMQKSLFCNDGLDNLDLAAIVSTALLAHSVRQVQRTAFRACDETGNRQLPVRAAALVASCFGYFSLRYCHCDTSLIFQRRGSVARPY